MHIQDAYLFIIVFIIVIADLSCGCFYNNIDQMPCIYSKNKPPLCLYVFLISIALMTGSLIHYTLLLANWRWNSIQWTYSVHQLQLSIVRLGLRSIMWVWWQWEKRREQDTWWPYLVYSSFCGEEIKRLSDSVFFYY